MFRPSKCSSSGRLIHAVLWYFFHSEINPLTPELNPFEQRCLTKLFTGNFASLTMHFINICVKTNKHTNYTFSLLIMYGISYMFRHYIAILRERF
jgi:hypothetical protein